jgi:hypothetical protein
VFRRPGLTILEKIGRALGTSTLLILLSTAGLLSIPAHCICGSDVWHGHSLFELSHHRHDARAAAGSAHEHGPAHEHLAYDYSGDEACDSGDTEMSGENALVTGESEFQQRFDAGDTDGPTLRAPASSSFGQPMTLLIAASVAPVIGESGCATLPALPRLRGLVTTPETPPPRVLIVI